MQGLKILRTGGLFEKVLRIILGVGIVFVIFTGHVRMMLSLKGGYAWATHIILSSKMG